MLFREKRSMTFVWDGRGHHYGVLAQRRGDRVQILRTWYQEASGRASHGELLARGIEELSGGGDVAVLVGGDVQTAVSHDLVMPAMAADHLTRAIEFELEKVAPLQPDDVSWVYRDVGPAGNDQRRIRLGCLPAEQWQHLLEGASGLGRGVDMIIPASAALDPVLQARAVCFQPAEGGPCYLLEPGENGERRVRRVTDPDSLEGVFGVGDTPLADEHLQLGPLAELPAALARGFAPAVVLAMYGVSRGFVADRKQVRGIPHDLRPRRNTLLKASATLLMLFLVVAVLFGIGRHLYHRNQQVTQLRAHHQKLATELAGYRSSAQVDAELNALRQALLQAVLSRRSVAEAMLEITTALDERIHARRMSWNDGKLSLYLTSKSDSPDVLLGLNQSETFDKYTLVKRENVGDSVTYHVDLMQKDYLALGHEALAEQRQRQTKPERAPAPEPTPDDEAPPEPLEAIDPLRDNPTEPGLIMPPQPTPGLPAGPTADDLKANDLDRAAIEAERLLRNAEGGADGLPAPPMLDMPLPGGNLGLPRRSGENAEPIEPGNKRDVDLEAPDTTAPEGDN